VEGWGKIVAGVVIGVAGTVYATNEELRKQLPEAARDLPGNVRRRFESARSAAREASSRRREEILRDLERHDVAHAARVPRFASEEAGTEAVDPVPRQPTTDRREATESIEEESR
jgi:cation transport regulator ChaB